MSQTDSERQVCLFSAVWNLQKKRKNESRNVFGKRKMQKRGKNENKCEG